MYALVTFAVAGCESPGLGLDWVLNLETFQVLAGLLAGLTYLRKLREAEQEGSTEDYYQSQMRFVLDDYRELLAKLSANEDSPQVS